MKKEKLNDESVYVLEQPKHITLSIVVMNSEVPLNKDVHVNLDKLSEISDVMLIFPKKFYKFIDCINYKKFTSLYHACGFIVSNSNLATSLLSVLEYSKEVFKKHVGITILNLNDLYHEGDIDERFEKNILEVNNSTIIKPIFKIERLGSRELFDIYTNTKKESKLLSFIRKIFNIEEDEDIIGMYSGYGSISNVIYMKNCTANLLINLVENKKDYIDSFNTEDDIKIIVSSFIKKFGIDNLNANINELEINKLS